MEGEKDKHFNGLTSATLETHLTDSNGIVAAANIESTRNVSDEPLTSSCGWSLVHPACLQRFAIPKCLLFWLCWAATLQGMIVNGFVNVVITTIERRFELRSIETGIIAGSYDIASVLCLIPVSYFGGTACKPLWIGCGMVVMGLGSLIFAIPHFATPIYTAISDNQILCRETILQSASETMEGSCWSLGALSNYKYIFIMAQLLHGIGAAPLYTLGVILLDDNFTTKMASVYIAVYYSMSIIGPAIGYVVGGQFLKLHTELGRVKQDSIAMYSYDNNWVGAWWLGFLMAGSLSLMVAIPIAGFPKELPGSREIVSQKVLETDQRSLMSQMNFGISAKDLPKALRILLSNPPFMLLSIAGAFEALLLTGFATFLPKFAESQFGISASVSAFIMGSITVASGGGGTFLGGYLIKRLKLNCESIIKMCFVFACISFASCCVFFVTCPNLHFAGLNAPYHNESSVKSLPDLNSSCNTHCHCSLELYDPICGFDNTMYYSPCYAGCTQNNVVKNQMNLINQLQFHLFLHLVVLYASSFQVKNHTVFSNCSCINVEVTEVQPQQFAANRSLCGNACYYLPLFSCFMFVFGLFSFLSSMPALSATLRCVPDQQKSFALGIQWIVVRLLGSIPAPIIFGVLMDATCLFRHSGCGRQGSCKLHNNYSMSRYFLISSMTGKFFSTLCFFLAWHCYKPPNRDEFGLAPHVLRHSPSALSNPTFVEDDSILPATTDQH